ncbi:DNA polymerase Y family protein [Myxococcota bacterium]|nr:DNA polymerase Y family protein [Myxococcota bacterium]
MPGRRLAWLDLPRLPAERHAGERDLGPRVPLVLWEEAGSTRRVASVSIAASALGVEVGSTLAAARARVPDLRDAEMDPAADAAALAAVAEALLAFTPSLAVRPPSGIVLEIGRCARLFGGEEALVGAALDATRRLGFTALAGVADGELGARVLARSLGRPRPRTGDPAPPSLPLRLTVAPPRAIAAAAADLPVGALPLPAALLEALEHLGLDTVGAFAALPGDAVGTRFGPEAAACWRAVNGREVPGPLPVFRPPPHLLEAAELEEASSGEGVLFRIRALLERLEERLRGRGEGASSLTIWLSLDDGDRARLPVTLSRPMRQAASLLRVVRERLHAFTVDAPITGVAVEVTAVAPLRGAQAGLFVSAAEQVSLLEAVARLEGAFGPGAVFAAVPRDRHRPEAAWGAEPFSPPPEGHLAAPGRRIPAGGKAADPLLPPPRRPLTLLQVPEEVEWVEGASPAPGAAAIVRDRRLAVASVRGPERLRGEWWTASPYDRAYHEVGFAGGARAWMYHDGATGRYMIHGWFD